MSKLKKLAHHVALYVALLLPQPLGANAEGNRMQGDFNLQAQQANKAVMVSKDIIAPQQNFTAWLKAMHKKAAGAGISKETIERALPLTMTPIVTAVSNDRKQPEKTRTFDEYVDGVVNQVRIKAGYAKIEQHHALLDSVGRKYKVDPAAIVALWGIETNYGATPGNYDVVRALATLAHDGRRAAFFTRELLDALRILDEGHIAHKDFKGSWAGAMGQTQFMPSSFFAYAQDFDGDGKRDIWKNHADIFASAANYLKTSGWRAGESFGHRVILPAGFDANLLKTNKPLSFWKKMGVKLADGSDININETDGASIYQPDGPGTAAVMGYKNYEVVLKWNYSSRFATSVGKMTEIFRPKFNK